MTSIDDIERRASKLLIAMGIALLVAIALLVLNNLVLRGTTGMSEMRPAIEDSRRNNIIGPPAQIVSPAIQERFYK